MNAMFRRKISSSNSIFQKLLFAFVLVVLTPALIIGAVSAWSSYQIGRQRTMDQLDSVVTLKSAEIGMWTDELSIGLESLVGERDYNEIVLPLLQGQLSSADARQAHDYLLKNLNLVLAKTQLFDRVCLMDGNGKVIVSTDPARENQNLSGTDYYQQGLQKHFISPPFYDDWANDKRLVIVVSQPIVAPGQGAVGVLAGYSNLTVLDRILEEPIGLGQTGESYLVGANYAPLTQLRFPTDIIQMKSDGIRLAVENKIRGQGMYRDYRGVPVVGAYTWLPTLQVALLVEQDQAEAFGSTVTMLEINLGVALTAVLLAVLVAFRVTRNIAKPLMVLSAAATQIAAGNLDHVAEVNRQDEIGTLAQAFNLMTARLRNLIKELQAELSERKRAEAALRESEEKFRNIYAQSPIAIELYDANGKLMNANPACLNLFGVTSVEQVKDFRLFDDPNLPDEARQRARNGEAVQYEFMFDFDLVRHAKLYETSKTGRCYLDCLITPWMSTQDTPGGYLVHIRDITAHKQAEDALRESESLYRLAIETAGAVPYREVYPQEDSVLVEYQFIGEGIRQITGYGPEEFTATLWEEMTLEMHPLEDLAGYTVEEAIQRVRSGKNPFWKCDFKIRARDGSVRWVFEAAVELRDEHGLSHGSIGLYQDITERKLAEERLRESENKLRALFAAMTDIIIVLDADGRYLEIAPTDPTNLYRTAAELLGRTVTEIFPPNLAVFFLDHIRETLETGKLISAEYSLLIDNQVRWFSASVSPLTPNSVIWVAHDITHLKQVEEKIQRQLEHLATLSMIDRVITSSFDLRSNLDTILTYAMRQLGADAASILLLDPDSLMLSYNAWRGFHTNFVEGVQVRLGESCAGQAAMEHRIIQVANLKDKLEDPLLQALWRKERFTSYCNVPLLVKGKALGVLEVFHRAPFHPDQEWLDFLNTLAGQTAIAIDNSQLFDGLQRSNFNLMMAYDATIEGWSRAMDLRDRETEGHTQRVTELTLKLARTMNVDEAKLIHIHRGALLHDIGKLGVPDSILFKPGKLTKKEMEIMRRHPIYAHEMLNSITYLRPAIDIPYCHHEKWDGTGYPRGLKGEEIPLAARLFAVVDVWDALCSTRYYRAAWPARKTRQYLLNQSGKHFDPRLVDAFLDLIQSKS
jgi:PAS domain S-box-containing protein